MFASSSDEILSALDREKPDFFVLYDDGFNYLTKMCLSNMREAAFRMIRLAKERGAKVILSSSDSTDQYEQYLKEGADFVLMGEAEQTLLELIHMLENKGEDFISISGIAYQEKEAVVKTPRRAVMKDLDRLPFPAWDLVDIEPYRKSWLSHAGYFSLNMGTTRGCPFKCNWCAKPIYGNRYNSRSPANVVEELKFLKAHYQVDHIWFCDDIFGLKPGWVTEFERLLRKENIRIRFKIQARADLLLQEDYIHALAGAGCENIWMGAESGSQKILDAMDKGITVEQIYRATRLLKQEGIHPSFFIQFGYPGETREDIRKTIDMINELLPYEIGISVSYPLPGTAFFERVKSDMKEKTHWTDSDELKLMFRNTYQPAFYKQLHRYVHKSYRKHLALAHLKNLVAHPGSLNPAVLRKAASIAYYIPAAFLAKQKLRTLEKGAV
jgi:anaerobic magnesium-protoporphyrin IX monomethyl ester cyclase